jgi:DNA-binding XRE family transcriptional regulator
MKIKVLLIQNRMQAQELAEKLGMKKSTLSNRTSGKTEFTIKEAIKLMEIFGKTFEEIFLDK